MEEKRKGMEGLERASENAYDYAYENAMTRINGQQRCFRELAINVLSWICSVKRLLATDELRHALAVEPNTRGFDTRNIPYVEDIVSSCAGLVTVDEGSNIIRLVHYTTKEYFERTGLKHFPDAHNGP
jgi:hypothetical protein